MLVFVPPWRVVALEAIVAIILFAYGHWIIGGIFALGAVNGAYRRAFLWNREPHF